MTDQFIDRRNEEFAAYLQCDALLVEEVYTISATAVIPDPEEAQETTKTLKTYRKALKHLERLEAALAQLPDIEHGVFQIQRNHWSEAIPTLREGLRSSLMVAQERKRLAAGRGQTNHQAKAIAEFVAKVFERLNRPVTFGVNPYDDEPSTDFGRAVQKCLTIYNTRAAPKKTLHYTKSGTQSPPFELIENGAPADWRRPAEAAFNSRKPPNA